MKANIGIERTRFRGTLIPRVIGVNMDTTNYYKCTSSRKSFYFVFFIFILISMLVPSSWAHLSGDPRLFKLVAIIHQSNKGKIYSWQGEATREEVFASTNSILSKETQSINYVFDISKDALRWSLSRESRLVDENSEMNKSLGSITRLDGMLKDDAFYKYWPSRMTMKGEKKNTLVIWPKQKSRKLSYSEVFHPMWYLTGHMTKCTDDLAERLLFFYEEPNMPALSESSIYRNNDSIVFTLNDKSSNLTHRYEFDLSKGGNITKYISQFEKDTEVREWSYEEIDNVWIPRSFAYEYNTGVAHSLGHTKRTINIVFSNSVLNKAIPSSEFTIEKLGIRAGDPITDRINGLSYFYKGK